MRRVCIVCGLLLLAGCGHSPPTRFYTLEPAPGPRAEAPVRPVQLKAVHLPSTLDRPQMVTRVGDGRLRVDDQNHWGAPLDELMRQTLAQDLATRLPQGAFVAPQSPKPQGARGLVVDVLQLDADASGHVTLKASWSLVDNGSAILSRNVDLEDEAPSASAQGQAAALSRLVGRLADAIAAALAPPEGGAPPSPRRP